MSKKVVTFGELLLRLSPPDGERFLQSPSFAATFGGAEANVAVSLAQFGFDSHFVTQLPENALGDAGLKALRAEGVDTRAVCRGGERLGIYFAEKGASQRPSVVIYDRAASAIAEMGAARVAWRDVFDGASWFHTSGITPALSPLARASTRSALAAAKQRGATVSFDLNFRRKLWSPEEAQAVIPELLGDVDLLIANEEDLQATLGVTLPSDVSGGKLDAKMYGDVVRQVAREFQLEAVAISLRESFSASENGWRALLYVSASDTLLESRAYRVQIVDRIGAGDAFAAGLIGARLFGRSDLETLEFAVAAGALKHSLAGDFNRVSVSEIDRLVAGDGSGRVQR